MFRAILAFLLTMLLVASASEEDKITVDPNAPGGRPAQEAPVIKDPRLDQKITYKVKLRPIADLTDDLTKLTGVTFYAGRAKSDWRVREDCATVMAADLPLSALMESIAHVMKFRWSRGGKAPNWTYRLVEDPAVIAKIQRKEEERKKKDRELRQERLDKVLSVKTMTADELAKLKEEDPLLYLMQKAGGLDGIVQLFQEAPAVKEAWVNGEDCNAAGVRLPPGVQQALVGMRRALIVDSLKDPESSEYAMEMLDRFEKDSSRMMVRIYKPHSPSYPFPSLIIEAAEGTSVISLTAPRSEAERLRALARLRASEEKRSAREVYMEMKDQIAAAEKKSGQQQHLWSYTQEPVLDHPDDDTALAEPLKENVAPKTLTGLIESLSKATGFAFVTDDYRGRTQLTFGKGTKLRKVFNIISARQSPHNWNRRGQVIELWDTNWYDNRNARVSKAWLEELRRKLRENGTLDIDDLAQVAALTVEQISKNFGRDDVLECVCQTVYANRYYLRIYTSLSPAQRSVLFSESGLAFTDLTPEQQQPIMKLVLGTSASFIQNTDLASLGIRITCTREPDGKRFVYTLKAYTNLGPVPDQARFRTPLYTPPHSDQPE